MNTYFAMDDTEVVSGVFPIQLAKAKEYNARNYGIFWCLNEFRGGIRRIECLEKINCWAIDMDNGTKPEQLALLRKSPLSPSMVIESKRGHHVYWFARDGSLKNFKSIVADRLVPFFNADPRARDVCRILRVPGFYHCKDPNDRFLIKEIKLGSVSYYEKEMLSFFKEKKRVDQRSQKTITDLQRVEPWLEKLSGTPYVMGETFSFYPNTNGTKQIVVNGKKTSSWVDKEGLIGSYDRGGPGIPQWLCWYHHDYRKVGEILKAVGYETADK